MSHAELRKVFHRLVPASRERCGNLMAAVLALPRSASKYLYGVLLNVLEDHTPVFHTHGLSERRTAGLARSARSEKLAGLERTQQLRKAIEECDQQFVFVPYRDPIARVYSGFVRNFSKLHELRGVFDKATATFHYPDLIQHRFVEYATGQLAMQREWPGEEVAGVFGVSLVEMESPANSGFSVVTRENVSLVLLRTENLERCLADALHVDFPVREERRYKTHEGRKVLKYGPGRWNSAAERGDSDLDQAFRQTFFLPASMVDDFYAVPEVQHIYAPVEIQDRKASLRLACARAQAFLGD